MFTSGRTKRIETAQTLLVTYCSRFSLTHCGTFRPDDRRSSLLGLGNDSLLRRWRVGGRLRGDRSAVAGAGCRQPPWKAVLIAFSLTSKESLIWSSLTLVPLQGGVSLKVVFQALLLSNTRYFIIVTWLLCNICKLNHTDKPPHYHPQHWQWEINE